MGQCFGFISFFIIGFLLKVYLPVWVEKISSWRIMIKGVISVFLIPILYLFLIINKEPYMYANGFGCNYFVFLLGGVIGSFLILVLSVMLEKYRSDIIIILSKGTIVILGYHRIIIELIQKMDPSCRHYSGWLYSLVILIAFYPVILCCSKFSLSILGGRVLK